MKKCFMNKSLFGTAVCVLALLTACGGGGGSSNSTSNGGGGGNGAMLFNISALLQNFYSSSQNFNLTALDANGNSYSMQWEMTAPVNQLAPNFIYSYTPADKKTQIQVLIAVNNGPVSTTVNYDRYFRSNPFTYSYLQRGGAGPITIYNALTAPPTSSMPFSPLVLAGGKIFAPTYVADTSLTMSLTAIDANTGWFCLASNDSMADPYHASAPEECVKTDVAGQVLGLKILYPSPVNGQMLYFQ